MSLSRKSRWPLFLVLVLALLAGGGPAGPIGPARADGPTPSAGSVPWSWPLGGPEAVLDSFVAPPAPWAAGHRGVDLRSATGAGIRSPAAGVVRYAGVVVDREVLTIDHGGGVVSSFEPVTAELDVGARVVRGQQVATTGTGGHCAGVCLHWGVRLNGEYIDPLSLLMDRRPSILLPVPAASLRQGPGGRPRA
ncbi:MAG: M23 family metallopeptidase [Arthrobacter sp.]